MAKDYYKIKINEIKKLLKTNVEKAYENIKEELDMPYIPQIYEKQFIELEKEIRNNLSQYQKINNNLNKEQVINILLSNDKLKIPMALSFLADLNLNSMISYLKTIFKKNDISNIVKTVIYEYCVEQKINHIFEWNELEVNPFNLGSVLNLDIYKKAYTHINNKINKNPSLKKIAIEQLELYMLKTFPTSINLEECLGPIFIEIAHEYMGIDYKKTDNSEKIRKIKEILQNNI